MKTRTLLLSAGAVLLAIAAVAIWRWRQPGARIDPALEAALNNIISDYRKIIVLVEDADTLDAAARARSLAAGRVLFWRKQNALEEISRRLLADYQQAARASFRGSTDSIRQFIRCLNANAALHDADKLAFLDLAEELEAAVPPSANGGDPLAAPLRSLHDDLQSIQLAYREEVTRIFRSSPRAGNPAGGKNGTRTCAF